MPSRLTEKHKRFAEEFLVDLDQGAAYRRAGYKVKNDATARANASRLLTNANVQAYIQEIREQQKERTLITADRVLQELARIGFANITDVLSFNGNSVTIKDSGELEPDVTASIAEVSMTETETEFSTRRVIKLKMHNKLEALKLLAVHTGVSQPKAIEEEVSTGIELQLVTPEMIRGDSENEDDDRADEGSEASA